MKIIIDILSSIALLAWPLLMMISPMLFDAPGSEANKSRLLFLLFVIFYPVLIFALYKITATSYFRFSADKALIVAIVITMAAALLFGYPRMMMNTLAGISENGYFVKDDKVYYYGSPVKQADAASFKPEAGTYPHYAMDIAHVFFNGRLIRDADVASFVPIPNPGRVGWDERAGTTDAGAGRSPLFWKDKHRVYVEGVPLPDSVPGSFRHIGGRYGSDGQHVYYDNRLLTGAHAGSFQLLGENIARDDEQVYILGKATKPAGGTAGFTLIDNGDDIAYARDGQHVYAIFYRGEQSLVPIVDADPGSFIVLARSYSKDGRHVYYKDTSINQATRLEQADAASFVTGNYDAATASDAHDHSRYYLAGQLVKAK